ncbi:MAG: DUF167 domain-containing protein [Planctomycetia bacterium]|nr:DUF167 domain-containing protein [Planctomycetia bacterium]
MVDVRAHPAGAILTVRAQPGARRVGVRGEHNGMLKVSVTAAAEKGKANAAVQRALAAALDVAASDVELVAGATSRQKQFLVRGLAVQQLRARIAAAMKRAPAGD